MAPVSPSGHPSVSALPDDSHTAPAAPRAAPPSWSTPRRLITLLAALLLLHLSNPLTWGEIRPGLWYPPVGLGLALIAWYGRRAALWLALDGLLVVLQALVRARWEARHHAGAELALAGFDAVLGATVLLFSWWLYHERKQDRRGLDDPRTAKRFLFLVPGLGLGLGAVFHTLLFGRLVNDSAEAWRSELPAFWLSRALGVLALTPLLVVLTPWLARRGLVRPDVEMQVSDGPLDMGGGSEPLNGGDRLELFGLSAGAAVLTWLAVHYGLQQSVGWQLWGAPLLVIVWASLRQGLRGGTLVASASAVLSLLSLMGTSLADADRLLIQCNLVGQCAVALLVASASGWLRRSEARYRQVMAHLPVVIYSARFRPADQPPPSLDGLEAEVMLVSAGSEPILGCRSEELLGDYQRWLQRVHSEDREVLRAAVAQLRRQLQPVTCEYRLARIVDREADQRSAPVRWVRDTLAPRLDAQGRLIGWEGVLTDITEQRLLADDLRRTTSMLHALVSNLPAGVFFVQGPTGHPILVNARARSLLGQREELAAALEHLPDVYRLHRPDGTPYPVEDLPVFRALHLGVTSMREDIVVHRPDGRRTPLVTWAAPVSLTGGNSTGPPDAAVWVLEDLTALHQAEAARRDTEVRLRAVLETMAEGLVVLDNRGCIVDVNTTAGAILGHPPERLRGLNLSERNWSLLREDGTPLPSDDSPSATVLRLGRPVRNLIVGIFQHGPQGEERIPKPEEVRWVLTNAMPLGITGNGENRAVAGVVVTYIDMTASMRAQRMLRESEERYRELVESLPLMVVQANPNMHVTYANPALRDITGYDLGEVADPQAWSTLIYADDVPILIDLTRQALEGNGGRAEFRYRAKDGSEKFGLAFIEPRRRSDGAIVGTTTLIADLTRERRLEQELLRAQRLELVGRISSGIAHDFNNLLSVVLSLTELISSSLPPGHVGHSDLARIRDATEQAANLANQLLTFSKQRHVDARRIDVNLVIARTLELLRASLPARIKLRPSLREQDLFIQADETQLQQVLMNLCLNARDAMPEGGVLRVQTERVRRDGDWVRLTVQDSGTGMTDQVKAHLFDPFFSTKDHGTGLGLAVVRQIVESHGGHVEVASEPGHGTRFDVWWPLAPGDAK
jgi:PAS domain S-box-containing protein